MMRFIFFVVISCYCSCSCLFVKGQQQQQQHNEHRQHNHRPAALADLDLSFITMIRNEKNHQQQQQQILLPKGNNSNSNHNVRRKQLQQQLQQRGKIPSIQEEVQEQEHRGLQKQEKKTSDKLMKKRKNKSSSDSSSSSKKESKKKFDDEEEEENNDNNEETPPTKTTVPLNTFPQWRAEQGYWIGEYSFYQSDGTPFVSNTWNYRYDAYRGFITGNIRDGSYRQRNVFLYPPQHVEKCTTTNNSVIGQGTCGVNGNTKIFQADQTAQPGTQDGRIDGLYAGFFETTTELIGKDNALLYQVFLPTGQLFQSQLTTLTNSSMTVQQYRTRTAQSFDIVTSRPNSVSFYREEQVEQEEFYQRLKDTLIEYNILSSDTCAWMDGLTGGIVPTIYAENDAPGLNSCIEHLESSFDL